MRVLRVDERLRQLVHPELSEIEVPELGHGDVLLTCAGFEDRASETLRRAVCAGCKEFRVICVEYLPELEENRTEEVTNLCERGEYELERATFDRVSPAGMAERILARLGEEERLCVDVSGMSKLLIVQMMSAIVRCGRLATSEALYCSARDYGPVAREVEYRLAEEADVLGLTMFVSSGVFGLTVVPELSSVAMQGQPMRAIVFPSWNTMQLAAVCSELQASYFTLVHGDPPSEEREWRSEAIRKLNRVETLGAAEEVSVSTLDYRETLDLLLRIYGSHGGQEKLVVIPTGSKMQSVAVGLVCGYLRDIQVVYPTPRVFAAPADYTQGVGCLYRLRLGSLGLVAGGR